MALSAMALTAVAEETMVYDLREASNFDINRQFSVDKDEEPWMWARYNIGGNDVSGPEQYNSSYTDGYYSSAYYTPALTLQAGEYKVYMRPRKKNSDAATRQNPDLRVLLAQGDMTESAYVQGKMTEVGRITDIRYASAYSGTDYEALPIREVTFTIATPGEYKIAFFNVGAAMTLHETYIVMAGEGSGSVDPDPGTDPDPGPGENPDPDDPVVDPDDPDDPVVDPVDPAQPLDPVDLPFSDSFAGASFGNKWQAEPAQGGAYWEATGDLKNQLPIMNVYDGDGGMAVFRGWDGNNGDVARLVSAPITKSSSSAPVIEFMFGHSGARATTDYVKVQVQKDDGEWQDVEGAVIRTYIPEIENGGWTPYKYPLDSYIDGCNTYRVGFLGVCENLNANIPIDAVSITNAAGKDLALIGLSASETVAAGKDLELTLTLENLGALTLGATDYTVTVQTDYPMEVKFTPVEIPAYTTVELKAQAKVTAEEVLDGPSYTFAVKMNVPDNASGVNLESDPVAVTTVFVDHRSPEDPKAVASGSGVALTWESVKDLDHTPISIVENFNDLPAHHQEEVDGERVWIEGAKGNFNGFVSLDFDKMDGGTYYSTSGSEFQVFQDFMTGSMPQGHSGQYIGLTLPANIQQDDWLISPRLEAAETANITFWARIAYIHRESDSYNNSLEVLYATEDYDVKNPAAAFKKTIYTNTSKATYGDLAHDGNYHWLYLNEVPAEAKYVALHFNTKSGMQTGVWIDRITIGEKDLYPLTGYYVYRRNAGRLNETPLAPAQLSYVVESADVLSSDLYYITALYDDGESSPSEMVGRNTGASSVGDDTAVRIAAVDGAVVITGAEGEDAAVYSLDGTKVASMRCTGLTVIPTAPGLYIVKAGATTAKLIVK